MAKFLRWQGVKIALIVEFTNSTFCTFNDFFHFPGLNWSLKHVKYKKATHCFIYTHFAVGGKGLKNASWLCAKFSHLPNKIPFQTNKVNVQKRRNIKICCDLSHLSAQPIEEICLFFVMTVYNTRWKVLMKSRNNTIHSFFL